MSILHPQRAFNSGELSPTMRGRTDVSRYESGLSFLENFVISPQGALYRRPGSRHISEVPDSTKKHRLIPFVFSNVQAYVLEFGHQTMRVYKDGGIVLLSLVPYQITTPWSSTDLDNITFAQSADFLYVCHPNYPPHRITRTGHTAWTIAPVDFQDGPYLDMNKDATHTLTISATTGAITVTSSAPVFNPNHVGSLWRIEESASSKHNPWSSGVSFAAGTRCISGGYVYLSGGGTTGSRAPVHTSGVESDGGVNWTFLHKGFGIIKITAYISPTQCNAVVISRCPDSAVGGTIRWREGAWSDHRGWPRVVCFYNERLVFASSKWQTQTVWMSNAADFENFAPTDSSSKVLDTNGVTVTFASDTVNAIVWMTPQAGRLIVGTTGGEWVLQPASSNRGITPDNIEARQHSAIGSKKMMALKIGTVSIYAQRGGVRLREMGYSYEIDAFVSKDINLLADHILRENGGIKQLTYQQEPLSIIWGITENGTLIGCTYMKDQDVIAWHRHKLGGNGIVESIAVIPGTVEDELWLLVRRTVNNQTVRYVEQLDSLYWPVDPDDRNGLWHLDSAGELDSLIPVSTISGLDWLTGETVQIVVDGAIHPQKTVSGTGTINLDWPGKKIRVGLGYTSQATTLPVEMEMQNTTQGQIRRTDTIFLQLLNTYSLKYGDGLAATKELPFRKPADPMNEGHALFTGWKKIYLNQSYVDDGIYTIASNGPGHLMILCAVTRLTISRQ